MLFGILLVIQKDVKLTVAKHALMVVVTVSSLIYANVRLDINGMKIWLDVRRFVMKLASMVIAHFLTYAPVIEVNIKTKHYLLDKTKILSQKPTSRDNSKIHGLVVLS